MIKKKTKKNYYNKILKARRNVTDNRNIFRLKKKKWQRFVFFAKKKLKFFKRYKLNDPTLMRVIKFASNGNSFKKSFRNYLNRALALKLIYGKLNKKQFKNALTPKHRNGVNSFYTTFHGLETRLDSVIYRAKFTKSIRQARQLISHGHVYINGKKEKHGSNNISYRDMVSISNSPEIRSIVRANLFQTRFWPLPSRNLKINYNTLEVINTADKKSVRWVPLGSHLGLDKLRNNARFK